MASPSSSASDLASTLASTELNEASDTSSEVGSISVAGSDAPLGSRFHEPSIDGMSVVGGGDEGIRKEKESDVTDQDKQRALDFKAQANAKFKESHYPEALQLYTASLNINPFDPTVWCNRAAVRLKLEEFGLVVADTSKAIELNPKYIKAYYRRAVANLSILKPKVALQDFKKVLALDPNNTTARQQHDATVKLIKRQDFEKAIASDDEQLVSAKIRDQLINSATVEEDYSGPVLRQLPASGISKKSPYPTVPPSKSRPPFVAPSTPPSQTVGAEITQEFIDGMIEWFKAGKTIPKRYVWQIVLGAQEVMLKEDSLNEVEIPEGETANVLGDTHGQFFDFLHIFSLVGHPSPTHTMVFNGDFVDRGSWSTEVVITLFAYKWLYPRKVFLNRGNHETADMNKVYGFEGETKKKYSELTYKLFEETFITLPLATLVSASKPPQSARLKTSIHKTPTLSPEGKKRFFVVHGGLFSKDGVTLADIRIIDRIRQKQPGQEGLMSECLWTDPQPEKGRGPSKRGVGLCFGPDITEAWTKLNKVTAVIRSHEVRQEGYTIDHNGLCITVFSAPNYVDQAGNLAGVLTIDDEGEISVLTFKEQPHPPIRAMAYAGGFANLMGMV